MKKHRFVYHFIGRGVFEATKRNFYSFFLPLWKKGDGAPQYHQATGQLLSSSCEISKFILSPNFDQTYAKAYV